MPRTSATGLAQLVAEEGEALRAYRDVAGVWTIGVGLTAASGVVRPQAGMTISRAESRRLLAEALTSRYEPAVAAAMPGASQSAFDGGVSFHFNTGAIARAGWVADWRRGNRGAARQGLMAWTRAGGREIAGLRRRRMREADLILDGHYAAVGLERPDPALRRGARGEAVLALQVQLIGLGLLEKPADGLFGAATETAVRAFQSAHPQLTVDGVAGPATRAQIARALDLRSRAAQAAAGIGTAAAGTAALVPVVPEAARATLLLPAAIAVAAVLLLVLAALLWRRRDELRALFTLQWKL